MSIDFRELEDLVGDLATNLRGADVSRLMQWIAMANGSDDRADNAPNLMMRSPHDDDANLARQRIVEIVTSDRFGQALLALWSLIAEIEAGGL